LTTQEKKASDELAVDRTDLAATGSVINRSQMHASLKRNFQSNFQAMPGAEGLERMIFRNRRCEAPGERRSGYQTRAGKLEWAYPSARRTDRASLQSFRRRGAGNGRIDFPTTRSPR
jgi:hypothetical protein